MDTPRINTLLARQEGVVARFQVLAHGGNDVTIASLLRQRQWRRVHRGVYVTHTGPLTWHQRAWAAVLCCWPSLLDGPSALRAYGVRNGDRDGDVVRVVVEASRRVTAPPGVVVRRTHDLTRVARWDLWPPRTTLEHAVLHTAALRRRVDAAVAVLADVCQMRRTDPERLRRELGQVPTLRGRRFLAEVLTDVASGAMSALERRYLRDVERAHGLPRGTRQAALEGCLHDIRYVTFGLVVELDGRLGHEWTKDRWKDLDRDLISLAHDLATLRLGWQQVLYPCRTASAVGRALQARGWQGAIRRCGPRCRATR